VLDFQNFHFFASLPLLFKIPAYAILGATLRSKNYFIHHNVRLVAGRPGLALRNQTKGLKKVLLHIPCLTFSIKVDVRNKGYTLEIKGRCVVHALDRATG